MSELVRLLSTSPIPPVDRSSPTNTTMSTGMASAPLPQPTSNTTQGQRLTCTLYGCQRVYTDPDSLARHIKDHQNHIPTQSLPGKVFLCSSTGCNGSFASMLLLMEHMRQHHKPNTYFLCQSCRSKLRSYRALLKHLHTCAKVARGKAKAGEQAEVKPDPDADPDAAVPMATDPSSTDQETPQQQEPMESEPSHLVPGSAGSDPLSALAPSPYHPPEDGSLLGLDPNSALLPGAFSLQEPGGGGLSATQLTQPPGLTDQPQLPEGSFGSFSQYLQSPLEVSGPELQQQQRPPMPAPPALPSSPPPQTSTPPGSNARWRKKGQSFNSRILWKHTRGRYSCVQCGHATPNRKEMTAHIKGQHKSPAAKPGNDTDVHEASPSSDRGHTHL
ncbi:zinc finger protein 414 isoform X1 [Coregonus clupeaformis]|uniref:zinc finger protein 414 isoform X1 n=2 Tax=Coregonus clupeaformis TaxID=59861 RepID=UPI001E1C8C5E|nr:zinc finger protein 414 isoform X1 [Coregonus clupeaformis]